MVKLLIGSVITIAIMTWLEMANFSISLREVTWPARAAAGIFLLAVIINFVIEFGFRGGGDKTKTSHSWPVD